MSDASDKNDPIGYCYICKVVVSAYHAKNPQAIHPG